MSDQSDFDEEFAERLRRMNLFFDTALNRAQLRTESWKAGAAIFGAGAAFAAASISLFHLTGR